MTKLNDPASQVPLRLAVLLLAAGEGSRLGSIPKALLKRDGQTLLQGFCETVALLKPVEFLVLTGFHMSDISHEMHRVGKEMDLHFHLVHNPDAHLGQSSSVRLGIESLKSDYDAVLIALSDQPEIKYEELMMLIKQFTQRDLGREIVFPMVGVQRGNPVIFSRKAIEEILLIPNLSCRAYMDSHPELLQIMHTSCQAFIQDVDTPNDLKRFALERP